VLGEKCVFGNVSVVLGGIRVVSSVGECECGGWWWVGGGGGWWWVMVGGGGWWWGKEGKEEEC
jgi:hypothetical protein